MQSLDSRLLSNGIVAYWCVCTVGALLSCVPAMRQFSDYGKLSSGRIVGGILDTTVPKTRFYHFYTVGTAFSALLLARRALSGDFVPIPLAAFFIHATKRLYESVYVHRFAKESSMHLFGYLLGLTFYVVAPTTIDRASRGPRVGTMRLIVGGILCTWGLTHQWRCHKILAALRSDGGNAYKIPSGDWFAYVSSPHYLAEIIVYIGFGCLARNALTAPFICLLIFVVCNLGLTAGRTHDWYLRKFRGEYPSKRNALIPFLY